MTISHREGALRPARHTPVLSGNLDTTGSSAAMTGLGQQSFTEGFDTADLKEAKALLEELK